MKKNLLPKMWMTALMAATAFAGVGTPVLAAAETNYGATIEGTKTTTFDKFLVMDKQANVPNATFTYAVTAGNAKAYDVACSRIKVCQWFVKKQDLYLVYHDSGQADALFLSTG